MKYFYPTTTLNFTNIISSQMLLPVNCYSEDSLWWNRFEIISAFPWDSVLVFLSKPPKWDIDDPYRDNYPLIIAFEGCPVEAKKRKDVELLENGKKIKAAITKMPVPVSIPSIQAGRVEFIFRNEDERKRMLAKAAGGVEECKVIELLLKVCPKAFVVKDAKKDTIALPLEPASMAKLRECAALLDTVFSPIDNMIHEERLSGAKLGYRIGQYIRSLRSGAFASAFREEVVFEDWRKSIKPSIFEEILGRIINSPTSQWNPNRAAVFSFVNEWRDAVKQGTRVDKTLGEAFDLLCAHWRSAEVRYKISEIVNPFLQGFAVFLECGNLADKYPRYLKSERLASPEYTLALYGALVGYTSFSRLLLDNENYLPVSQLEGNVESSETLVVNRDSVCERWRTPTVGADRKENVKQMVKGNISAKRAVQYEFQFADGNTLGIASQLPIDRNASCGNIKLISDVSFPAVVSDFVRKTFSWSEERQNAIREDAKWLQKQYAPNGKYGNDPKSNPIDNNSTVRHFVNLVNKNFERKRVPLTESQREQLWQFLRDRYK